MVKPAVAGASRAEALKSTPLRQKCRTRVGATEAPALGQKTDELYLFIPSIMLLVSRLLRNTMRSARFFEEPM